MPPPLGGGLESKAEAIDSLLLRQKRQYRPIKIRRLFELRNVAAAVKDHQLGTRYPFIKCIGVGNREQSVLFSPYNERRFFDLAEAGV